MSSEFNSPWPMVAIGDIAQMAKRPEEPLPGVKYRQVGVRLWGKGVYEREVLDGINTKYKQLYRTAANDIIVNKIWARNGSVAVVPEALSGCYASSEFPMYAPDIILLEPRWFHWITKTAFFWQQCDEKSHGTSGKNRIRPERFLEIEIPLPPLEEQQRIVVRIESLAAKVEAARKLREEAVENQYTLLHSVFQKVIANAEYQHMSKVAPIVRRWVDVDLAQEYHELGVRSFGKGTFHKPSISGLKLGSKRILWIEPGDLILMNVFAWEGAIAAVQPEDEGRVGSHRYITCVPKLGRVTVPFLCFYLLTPEGLSRIRQASPGGAGRNRTLGLRKLEQIKVPVPDYDAQVWFDKFQSKMNAIKTLQKESNTTLDVLIPSILDKAFKGEL
jgi:type I restriction enzyme S subunit